MIVRGPQLLESVRAGSAAITVVIRERKNHRVANLMCPLVIMGNGGESHRASYGFLSQCYKLMVKGMVRCTSVPNLKFVRWLDAAYGFFVQSCSVSLPFSNIDTNTINRYLCNYCITSAVLHCKVSIY